MKRTPEEKLLNPKSGSKIAAARDYGIDLTLLVSNLRQTPEQRLRDNEKAINDLNRLRDAVRTQRKSK